jgi:hypothetical protein
MVLGVYTFSITNQNTGKFNKELGLIMEYSFFCIRNICQGWRLQFFARNTTVQGYFLPLFRYDLKN